MEFILIFSFGFSFERKKTQFTLKLIFLSLPFSLSLSLSLSLSHSHFLSLLPPFLPLLRLKPIFIAFTKIDFEIFFMILFLHHHPEIKLSIFAEKGSLLRTPGSCSERF